MSAVRKRPPADYCVTVLTMLATSERAVRKLTTLFVGGVGIAVGIGTKTTDFVSMTDRIIPGFLSSRSNGLMGGGLTSPVGLPVNNTRLGGRA